MVVGYRLCLPSVILPKFSKVIKHSDLKCIKEKLLHVLPNTWYYSPFDIVHCGAWIVVSHYSVSFSLMTNGIDHLLINFWAFGLSSSEVRAFPYELLTTLLDSFFPRSWGAANVRNISGGINRPRCYLVAWLPISIVTSCSNSSHLSSSDLCKGVFPSTAFFLPAGQANTTLWRTSLLSLE